MSRVFGAAGNAADPPAVEARRGPRAPESTTLLDAGMALGMNDLGNGPARSPDNCPVVIDGSAGGRLEPGEHLRVGEGDPSARNRARPLNTIPHVAGTRSEGGDRSRISAPPS